MSERLDDFPADVQAVIMPTDAQEAVLLDREAAAPAPLGSMFKLYVLLAVADAVESGALDWDTTLTVAPHNRSLPSGELQDAPDGTQVAVREAATKMIEISDNTATDMLIQAVGRQAVEEAVFQADHHDPELLKPFVSTRELFQIGWGDSAHLESWQHGSQEARYALVEQLERRPIEPHDVAVGGDPLWPQGVEWYATPRDIAAVHVALQEHPDATVREILSQNPGVNQEVWDYVGYKGGSSPGVLTGSWYLEDAAGVGYVVVIQAATAQPAGLNSASHTRFSQLATSALQLTYEATHHDTDER